MKQTLHTWKCKCGKILESQWLNQLEQWKQQHLATHDKNNADKYLDGYGK